MIFERIDIDDLAESFQKYYITVDVIPGPDDVWALRKEQIDIEAAPELDTFGSGGYGHKGYKLVHQPHTYDTDSYSNICTKYLEVVSKLRDDGRFIEIDEIEDPNSFFTYNFLKIRTAAPTLITGTLATAQPMSAPSNMIFHINYTFSGTITAT